MLSIEKKEINVDSDEEEILIINPPPIDEEKNQKKKQYYQYMQEVYEWMIHEKQRKTNKQPKQEAVHQPIQQSQPPVIINMSQPQQQIQKELTNEEKILKDKILIKCSPIKF